MAEEETEMAGWAFWVSGLDKKELHCILFFVVICVSFKNKGIEVQGKRRNLSTLNQFIPQIYADYTLEF